MRGPRGHGFWVLKTTLLALARIGDVVYFKHILGTQTCSGLANGKDYSVSTVHYLRIVLTCEKGWGEGMFQN